MFIKTEKLALVHHYKLNSRRYLDFSDVSSPVLVTAQHSGPPRVPRLRPIPSNVELGSPVQACLKSDCELDLRHWVSSLRPVALEFVFSFANAVTCSQLGV